MSLNHWLESFSTRVKPVSLLAGQETNVKLTPTFHVATERFKALPLDQRRCLLPDEKRVSF